MYRQLYFNNKKSFEDFNLYIESFSISPPVPIVKEERIPYRSGTLDFSMVNSNRLFQNRIIEVTLFWKSDTNDNLFNQYSDIQMWLLNCFSSKISFDGITGEYVGKVREISDIALLKYSGRLTVNFECEPYKSNPYGEYLWDSFNFSKDNAPINIFAIDGDRNLTIHNDGISITPTITLYGDSSMQLIINSKRYTLNKGDNLIHDIVLENGDNNISLIGTGTIEFNFIENKF